MYTNRRTGQKTNERSVYEKVTFCDHAPLGITDMKTALLIGGVPVAHQLHRLKSDIKVR